ncbi:MAG: CoA-binding protein [Sarcina sp.]
MDANYLISNFKNWVVIGDVLNKSKYANRILNEFKIHSYNVVGIHPKGGETTYKTLSEVPYSIDVIDLCINPINGLNYLKEAKTLGIKYVLIQPDASSEDILTYCNENDIIAIQGCALVAMHALI